MAVGPLVPDSGGQLTDALIQLDVPGEEARFLNFAALSQFARSDITPPFPPARRGALNRLIKLHWADRVIGRVPWQVRERLGVELEDWMAQHPDPASAPAPLVAVPRQRAHPAVPVLTERAIRANNRGGRA